MSQLSDLVAELEFEAILVYHQSCDHNHGHNHAIMGLTTTWGTEHDGYLSCSPSQVNTAPTFTCRLDILLELFPHQLHQNIKKSSIF